MAAWRLLTPTAACANAAVVLWFLIAAAVGGAAGGTLGPVKRDEHRIEEIVRRLLF
jgi:hypothetical protein